MTKSPYTQQIATGLLLVAAGNACLASQLPTDVPQPFRPADWAAASDERLAGLRGGFELGAGLTVSFGIARTVMINGEVLSRTSFVLPDVGKITAEQASMARAAMGGLTVVQNGAGNGVAPNAFAPASTAATPPAVLGGPVLASGTVIQNSLDNQVLQHTTLINTGVYSLGLLKQGHAHSALRDALFGALGQR